MKDSTEKIVSLAIANDPDVTAQEKELITLVMEADANLHERTIDFMKGKGGSGLEFCEPIEPAVPRKEVARLFRKSPKWVDWAAKQPGTKLQRVYVTGSRSCGFSAASVRRALQGQVVCEGLRR